MAMPRDLILVRHGHSEANEVQGQRKANPKYETPPGFHDRHDSLMRLSSKGAEQAVATGKWLRKEFPSGFDAYFVSPHTRTLETAALFELNGNWDLDDRLRERDWGEFGLLNDHEREIRHELSTKIMGQNKWYWCPAGGESLATGVRLRYRSVLDTWHREQADRQVIAVIHGETIGVARFEHERMTPQEWLRQDKDTAYKLANCQIVHYSRVNPETGELASTLKWRRSICAWDRERSWQDGTWIPLTRKRYSDQELLDMVNEHPRLLTD